jgi:hypothetical protein
LEVRQKAAGGHSCRSATSIDGFKQCGRNSAGMTIVQPGGRFRSFRNRGAIIVTNRSGLSVFPFELQSTGDPVQSNPFPVESPLCQVWKDATRNAEQELCWVKSDLAKKRIESFAELAVLMIDLAAAHFDIWARRGVHVIWSNEDIRAYDQWLARYAESWLKTAREWCPVPVRVEALLNELKLRLIEKVEWWKAEARKYVSAQELHRKLAGHGEADDAGDAGGVGVPEREAVKGGGTTLRAPTSKTTVAPAGRALAIPAVDHANAGPVRLRKPEAQAVNWEDIEVSFLSEERVQISIGPQGETRNYEEMGFGSKKNGSPVLAWAALRILAEGGGVIRIAADGGKWAVLEKRMQEIRKRLCHLFGLTGDPVPYVKKSRNSAKFGYCARFKIGCRPSYES